MELGKKLIVTLAAACLMLAAMPARAEPPKDATPSVDEICRTLAQAAADNDLPGGVLHPPDLAGEPLRSKAVSPMGAQGIAQFMPATAAMRGLVNAFEPLQALRESASYLRELRTTFRGNLGLAAAAYNAGPAAVEAWLARRGYLPFETQAYVRIVTGYAAEAWIAEADAACSSPLRPSRPARAASSWRRSCSRTCATACRSRPARPGGHGASSWPATGPKAACSPPTNGCGANTRRSWATGCRWS